MLRGLFSCPPYLIFLMSNCCNWGGIPSPGRQASRVCSLCYASNIYTNCEHKMKDLKWRIYRSKILCSEDVEKKSWIFFVVAVKSEVEDEKPTLKDAVPKPRVRQVWACLVRLPVNLMNVKEQKFFEIKDYMLCFYSQRRKP